MKKAFIALAIPVAMGTFGIASAAANDTAPDHEDTGGALIPCNLDGINPALHPKIFGNAMIAAKYGFVRARDGTWQVGAGCGAPVSAYAPRPDSQKATPPRRR